MDADLTELYGRLDFCDDECAKLQLAMSDFTENASETRVVSNITGPWAYVMEIRLRHPLPVPLRTRVGMLINECKAILDSLANTLSQRNGKTNQSHLYFPISKTKEIFEDYGRKKMKALSLADQATIASLQPYGGGDNLLYILHELDRRRKHYRLNANSLMVGPTEMPFPRFGGMDLTNPEAIGTEFVPFLWFSDPACAQAKLSLAIFVSEPPVAKSSNFAFLLPQIVRRVRAVVDLFDRSGDSRGQRDF